MPDTISPTVRRRYILGQQGLYPARRWTNVLEAMRAGAVVQIDPLNVVARSHDISLYGRVHDYRADWLDTALYTDRTLFDHGGTVFVHPLEQLPYWRVVMARKGHDSRWREFQTQFSDEIKAVYQAVADRGPLSSRDLEAGATYRRTTGYRTTKVPGQALYLLWLTGELLTHSRRGNERVYDLRDRVAPPEYQHAATPDEADDYFMPKVFAELGLVPAKYWRTLYTNFIGRRVSPDEAAARLDALVQAGTIAPVSVDGDLYYVLASDLPLLATLARDEIPAAWPSAAEPEVTFLAPLEIVSARGRAKPLFNFEYIWEVYKPVEKRRWGYYTLPILYGDRLVGRFDSRLDRAEGVLRILGFWLEPDFAPDAAFQHALERGFDTFMRFIGASAIEGLNRYVR